MLRNSLDILKLTFFTILLITHVSCSKEEISQLTNDKDLVMKKAGANYVTLINSFEVPEGKESESIKYWEACRDFLKEQPGYISTKLHQSIKDDSRFHLVNFAQWETPQAFINATAKMQKELGVAPVPGLKPNASLYTVIRE